jgi:hypothetical protein
MLNKINCFLFLTFFFTGCKSATTVKTNVDSIIVVTPVSSPLPLLEKLTDAEQLTFTGDNRFSSIADDNTKILFASRSRTQHKEFQIYELNLTQGKEDRLTFNEGSTIDPIYADGKSQIYFASSTDEVKELHLKLKLQNIFSLPFSFYDPANMNLELYSLSLTDKKNIPTRLTEHSGYDANPQQLDIGDYAWVQKNQRDFKLFKFTAKNKKAIEIFQQPDPIWKASWNHSLSQWIWISWSLDGKTQFTKVFVLKDKSPKPELLPLPEGIYHDATWIPNENRLIISAQLKNTKDFDIYQFDLQEQCLRALITNPGDDIEPTINKKNSFLVFSHKPPGDNGNHFQLYKKNLNPPQEPCIKAMN